MKGMDNENKGGGTSRKGGSGKDANIGSISYGNYPKMTTKTSKGGGGTPFKNDRKVSKGS